MSQGLRRQQQGGVEALEEGWGCVWVIGREACWHEGQQVDRGQL